ncbi:MAG: ABC transporter permease, partial [Acidobacteriota bacterium]
MKDLLHDLRHGLRMLYRSPGFAAVTVLTLMVGIGGTTAVFSVVDAVLLRPLPYSEQDRLAVVWETARKRQFDRIETSYANYREWRDQNQVFEHLSALTTANAGMNLTRRDREPLYVEAAPVTANFFDTLGVRPEHGRAFLPEEDQLGAHPVAVLSDRLWREELGGDP